MNLAAELARYGPDARYDPPSAEEARAYCRSLAESHYENFTVVSGLFPQHLQQPLCNVYAYCRWADDSADEAGDAGPALLDWWEGQLDDMFEGRTTHPVFIALAETVSQFDIRRQPLADLLVAFRRDQTQQGYETMTDLLTYCEHSANPVGRIVLTLGRALNDENVELSDRICTGLQLANFCQDVRRDYASGRIYLPQEWCRRYGWDEVKFAAGRCDYDFRQLLKAVVDQAEGLLISGRPLARRVPPELRLPVRVFVAGGRAILAAIRSARYDVWSRRPTVTRFTKWRLLASSLLSGWWHG
jgi:squalene synthase HpnC